LDLGSRDANFVRNSLTSITSADRSVILYECWFIQRDLLNQHFFEAYLLRSLCFDQVQDKKKAEREPHSEIGEFTVFATSRLGELFLYKQFPLLGTKIEEDISEEDVEMWRLLATSRVCYH
jgi:hypothetical protein